MVYRIQRSSGGSTASSYGSERQSHFPPPAGVLVSGSNTLSIVAEDFGREISVGQCLLFNKPLRELLNLRNVSLTIAGRQSK